MACNICKDRGYVIYIKEVDKHTYEHFARCTCQQGEKYKYDGTKLEDEKNRSKFYIPSITDIDFNKCHLKGENILSF